MASAARRLQAPLRKRKGDFLSWGSYEAGFVGQLPLAEWKWHAACRTFFPVRTSFSSLTLGSLRCFCPFDSKRPASALHISAHTARWTGPPHLCRRLPAITPPTSTGLVYVCYVVRVASPQRLYLFVILSSDDVSLSFYSNRVLLFLIDVKSMCSIWAFSGIPTFSTFESCWVEVYSSSRSLFLYVQCS
jgi:hypothetical protein